MSQTFKVRINTTHKGKRYRTEFSITVTAYSSFCGGALLTDFDGDQKHFPVAVRNKLGKLFTAALLAKTEKGIPKSVTITRWQTYPHMGHVDGKPVWIDKLRRSHILLADAEWSEENDSSLMSLWSIGMSCDHWVKGNTSLNPNSDRRVAVFELNKSYSRSTGPNLTYHVYA